MTELKKTGMEAAFLVTLVLAIVAYVMIVLYVRQGQLASEVDTKAIRDSVVKAESQIALKILLTDEYFVSLIDSLANARADSIVANRILVID